MYPSICDTPWTSSPGVMKNQTWGILYFILYFKWRYIFSEYSKYQLKWLTTQFWRKKKENIYFWSYLETVGTKRNMRRCNVITSVSSSRTEVEFSVTEMFMHGTRIALRAIFYKRFLKLLELIFLLSFYKNIL